MLPIASAVRAVQPGGTTMVVSYDFDDQRAGHGARSTDVRAADDRLSTAARRGRS